MNTTYPGTCVFDTAHEDEDGSLRNSLTEGYILRVESFHQFQEYWYPTEAEAEADAEAKFDSYRGTSAGPAGLTPPQWSIREVSR